MHHPVIGEETQGRQELSKDGLEGSSKTTVVWGVSLQKSIDVELVPKRYLR